MEIVYPDIKRKKPNPRLEDTLSEYCLWNPRLLREVTIRIRRLYVGLFQPKDTWKWDDLDKGVRIATACWTQRVQVIHILMGQKTSLSIVEVDTERLVISVLQAGKKQIRIQYKGQQLYLSMWDWFIMDRNDEFEVTNLSRHAAQIQCLEWV